MVKISGRYETVRQENIEELSAALGIPYFARKMMVTSKPILEIYENGMGRWNMKSLSHIRNENVQFELGKEYQESTLDNEKDFIKCVTVLNKNKDTLETKCYGIYDVILTKSYKFTDDGCVLTMTHKETGVTAKRYYVRISTYENNNNTSDVLTNNKATCIA